MKTIRQTATIRGATPHGAFKVGRDLEGKHLALTKDRRIVQTWRANNWEKGHYSRATFRLAKAASGTRVTFTQTGVPNDKYAEISKGWRDYYWRPLRKQFGAKGRKTRTPAQQPSSA